MRCVIQRVKQAQVTVGEEVLGRIGRGFLVLAGMEQGDSPQDLEWMAEKIYGLRIFEDEAGKMNLALPDVQGDILLVSQFTLLADCRKGKRPGFSKAALPAEAQILFENFVEMFRRKEGLRVETGRFQADMDVSLTNWGPVTILLDSRKIF